MEGACAHCGGEATLRCAGCSDGVDMDRRLSRTAYCNKECQKVDWGTHKTACKDARTRKQLYRAGELVQTLFYDLREVAFDNVINGVEHKGDRLIVSAGYWDLPPSKIFTRFPTHLFPDAGDKQAMLVWNACGDSVCCMHELVETCLTGISKDVLEVAIQMPVSANRIDFYRADLPLDKTNYGHEVLKIGLRNGESYVLDLTSAQYGQMRIVTPWDVYKSTVAVGVIGMRSFGSSSRLQYNLVSAAAGNGVTSDVDVRVPMAIYKLVEIVNATVKCWEEDNASTVVEVLRAKQSVYEQQLSSLSSLVRRTLEDYLASTEKKGGMLKMEKITDADQVAHTMDYSRGSRP